MSEADDERMQGYMDGRDLSAPEPSSNRSASYRHGFAVGRADKAGVPAFGAAGIALELSDMAEREDASR